MLFIVMSSRVAEGSLILRGEAARVQPRKDNCHLERGHAFYPNEHMVLMRFQPFLTHHVVSPHARQLGLLFLAYGWATGDQGRDPHGTSVAKPGPDLRPSYTFTKVKLSEHFREL